MKQTLIILLLTISQLSNGQTMKQLEDKNGFKEFHFGDSLAKYGGELMYIGEATKYKWSIFEYIGNNKDLYEIFGLKLDQVLLNFTESKELIFILLTKDYAASDLKTAGVDIKSLTDNFAMIFGAPSKVENKEGLRLVSWDGDKVHLLVYLTFSENKVEASNIKVAITKKSEYVKELKKQF